MGYMHQYRTWKACTHAHARGSVTLTRNRTQTGEKMSLLEQAKECMKEKEMFKKSSNHKYQCNGGRPRRRQLGMIEFRAVRQLPTLVAGR